MADMRPPPAAQDGEVVVGALSDTGGCAKLESAMKRVEGEGVQGEQLQRVAPSLASGECGISEPLCLTR